MTQYVIGFSVGFHVQGIDLRNKCECVIVEGVRLANGKDKTSGRLEILRDKTWVTVCDVNFGKSEALVICSILGIQTRYMIYHISIQTKYSWKNVLRPTNFYFDHPNQDM